MAGNRAGAVRPHDETDCLPNPRGATYSCSHRHLGAHVRWGLGGPLVSCSMIGSQPGLWWTGGRLVRLWASRGAVTGTPSKNCFGSRSGEGGGRDMMGELSGTNTGTCTGTLWWAHSRTASDITAMISSNSYGVALWSLGYLQCSVMNSVLR